MFGTVEAQRSGIATINLRACLDNNEDGVCEQALDGVLVCFSFRNEDERCFFTEDGEYWEDSKRPGEYTARSEAPEVYHLVGIACTGTNLSNRPYSHCQIEGNTVDFKVSKNTNAVIIYFLYTQN